MGLLWRSRKTAGYLSPLYQGDEGENSKYVVCRVALEKFSDEFCQSKPGITTIPGPKKETYFRGDP